MVNVELVLLGHLEKFFSIEKVLKRRSRIYSIDSVKTISDLPEPRHPQKYIIQQYLDNQLAEILGRKEVLRIAIINCYLEDNFYVRMIDDQTVVISIKVIKEYLYNSGISIESFILKNILELITIYLEIGGVNIRDGFSIPHTETRGCLFDMNGELSDVVRNTESPKICDECKSRLARRDLPRGFIRQLEKETKAIKRPVIKRIEGFIKSYPLVSVLGSVIISMIINILSNIIYDNIR